MIINEYMYIHTFYDVNWDIQTCICVIHKSYMSCTLQHPSQPLVLSTSDSFNGMQFIHVYHVYVIKQGNITKSSTQCIWNHIHTICNSVSENPYTQIVCLQYTCTCMAQTQMTPVKSNMPALFSITFSSCCKYLPAPPLPR